MRARQAVRQSATSGSPGFALLLVIWIMALLAILAVGIAADSQTEAKIARNRMELARARGMAEAGVTLAMVGLMTPEPTLRWRSDGTTRLIQYAGGKIAITLQDEGGKIDLNRAPLELIAGLLDEFDGINRDDRDGLLTAIAARRKSFADAAPAPSRPSLDLPRRRRAAIQGDVAFASVSELRQLGVSRAIYDRIRPFLTVYSQNPTINPLTAPREILAALPGASPQAIDFYIAGRQTRAAGQLSGDLPSLGSAAAAYLATAEPSAVTIIATAETDAAIAFTREAVVAIDGSSSPPFKYLEWHRGDAPDASAAQ